MHDAVDDKGEAGEAHQRSHTNAQCRENLGVELMFVGTLTCHKDKTEDNGCHTDSQENEVHSVECKILHNTY